MFLILFVLGTTQFRTSWRTGHDFKKDVTYLKALFLNKEGHNNETACCRLEANTSTLEATALRLEAIALEDIAIRLGGHGS